MTPEEINKLALAFPGTTEEPAFGPGTAVYKVVGKVFAIVEPNLPTPQVTLKCEPSLAMELRSQFDAVTPGYHMNKKHWNTVVLDRSVPKDEVRDMVQHAYDRVVAGLPKKVRQDLADKA